MVKSDIFKIVIKDNFDNDYIESMLLQLGINPIRWAIVDIDSMFIYVSVSYQC